MTHAPWRTVIKFSIRHLRDGAREKGRQRGRENSSELTRRGTALTGRAPQSRAASARGRGIGRCLPRPRDSRGPTTGLLLLAPPLLLAWFTQVAERTDHPTLAAFGAKERTGLAHPHPVKRRAHTWQLRRARGGPAGWSGHGLAK